MLRLCLVVEATAKHAPLWHLATLKHVVEPLLAYLETISALEACELALVLFGAHPPASAVAVESTPGWCSSVAQIRQLLDGLQFMGGCNQPVALAEALVEAASLFALPASGGGGGAGLAPGATAEQQHCLVCLASDPAVRPVPWPYQEDCNVAKLPGLATSVDLCRALRRRGIHIGLAAAGKSHQGSSFSSSHMLWHVVNMLTDTPTSLLESRLDLLKRQREGTLQQLLNCTATTPASSVAFLPYWPQAVEVLQKAGSKPMSTVAALASGKLSGASTDVNPSTAGSPPTDADDARRARGGIPRPAMGSGEVPSPAGQPLQHPMQQPMQQLGMQQPTPQLAMQSASAMQQQAAPAMMQQQPTPPMQQQPTPPLGAQPTPPLWQPTPPMGGVASPGSFLEVMGAEILSPMGPDMMAAFPPPPTSQLAPPSVAMQQQQQLGHAGGGMGGNMQGGGMVGQHEPSVTGLPLPPVVQQQHMQPQAQIQPQRPLMADPALAAAMPVAAAVPVPAPAGGSSLALIHTARVAVEDKRLGNVLLGIGQVLAVAKDVPDLQRLAWPPEIRFIKTLPLSAASEVVKAPTSRQTRLKIAEYASQAALRYLEQLMEMRAVGVAPLSGGSVYGVLLPARHPTTQQVVLQLAIVPGYQRPM